MAPMALSPPLSPVSSNAPIPDVIIPRLKYNDWRADLAQKGYVVVKSAIPYERAVGYQEKAYEWLKSFNNPELDFENPKTWHKDNLPIQSKINTFSHYSVCHEKFMWDAKMEQGVLDAFALIWGTDKLLTSFDALNVTFPNRKDVPRKQSWEHVDQSPFRRGLHCIQGIINLAPSGPEDGGLVIYPGSHLYYDEFFDTQTDKKTWLKRDFFMYTAEQIQFFKDKGLAPMKVNCEPGDLILWDSRAVHYGSEPTEKGTQVRTAIYASYTPARLASEEALATKKVVFANWAGTTHWPHDNIAVRENKALFEDGTQDPRDRIEPREKPELTDQLLRLAGVLPY